MSQSFTLGIGGAAGQGVATPGDIFALIFSRRGLHLNAYNAYQSIIRGGHTFLTIRTGVEPVRSIGADMDLLIPLNQDTMDRHLRLLGDGGACIYNADSIKPGEAASGVQLCPLPVSTLADISRNKVAQNTLALGASLSMMGVGFHVLEGVLKAQFGRKGDAVVNENVSIARTGYDYATENFRPFAKALPMTDNRYAVLSGNAAMAMGGAAAGCKFYCAYPMSPSTGVLHWMASHGRKAGIMVRQVEDEIGVINMAIGASHAGVRSMCATSGGGFALMTEGLGLSAMAEIPVVVIDCQRAGPSTGVPTKTEQGDLWQMLGAAFGDYPRVIAAPLDIGDCFTMIHEIFNVTDKFQCPGIVLCDLLLSEGRLSEPAFGPEFPAKHITTRQTWDDLVLPASTFQHLEDVKAWLQFNEAALKDPVLNRRIKPGYKVLFYGPSGTGKTLAASLLGQEFQKEVFRIDLSQVVSKYIGETEKNLEKVFAKAEYRNWILFFDEADALFGKRSSVQNAHDKYANQEVSYLLQRIEDFPGLVILASNFKSNIDPAFLRRFNSIIEFPFPGTTERLQLWEKAMPPSFSQPGHVDLKLLAEKYALTGSAINQVIHQATLQMHYQQKEFLCQDLLLQGIQKELRKEDKLLR